MVCAASQAAVGRKETIQSRPPTDNGIETFSPARISTSEGNGEVCSPWEKKSSGSAAPGL